MRNAVMDSLYQLATDNSDVMLLTADLGFGVFEDFSLRFPDQYLNVGVAEQNMMGIASGLAMEGKTVFTYSIGNFPTLRCLEQIRNDACYHELNINIIASGGGFSYGGLGMSHHATEDLSIMRALPGVTVLAPSSAWEAGMGVIALADYPGVGYLRIDKSIIEDPLLESEFQIGKARKLREGDAVTIISTGGIAVEAIKAAEELKDVGLDCRVLSMHTIKPIDVQAICDAFCDTKGIVTVEENTIIGGLGSAIAEVCIDMKFDVKRVVRIGMNDRYSSVVGGQEYLRGYYEMDKFAISSKIQNYFL